MNQQKLVFLYVKWNKESEAFFTIFKLNEIIFPLDVHLEYFKHILD